jgi:hypothetical protein
MMPNHGKLRVSYLRTPHTMPSPSYLKPGNEPGRRNGFELFLTGKWNCKSKQGLASICVSSEGTHKQIKKLDCHRHRLNLPGFLESSSTFFGRCWIGATVSLHKWMGGGLCRLACAVSCIYCHLWTLLAGFLVQVVEDVWEGGGPPRWCVHTQACS